ncbi:MAG: diguanylate cyclase [Gammaproteobacteria bacterium]|nr:diguanylate cyclase [Gammaproteobacteria bacterium]MBU1655944.1 diguanylate cyclase [Gammaproteobacteria bacterium]MBU1960665.1 diguanylate cyclase [Gammaproteobacteria bacterium]
MKQQGNHSRHRWINRLARNTTLLLWGSWTLLFALFLQWHLNQAQLQAEQLRWARQCESRHQPPPDPSGQWTPWAELKAAPYLYLAYGTAWAAGILAIGFIGFQMRNNYTEIKHYQQELEHMATHDALTDFFNRNQMTALLEVEIERARRYGHNLGVLLLDIDLFKNINDQHGHQAGDIVLVSLAEILKNSVRTIDYVARFGGEEFLIIMPETRVEMALVSAERIRATIADSPIALPDGTKLSLTCSIGVAAYPTSGDNMDLLLNSADKALYSAKNLGRNRVVYCR